MIEAQDTVPVTPDRRTIRTPHDFRRDLYHLRNRVEHFVNKLSQFWCIATRYEALAANHFAMIKIAAISIWPRVHESTP